MQVLSLQYVIDTLRVSVSSRLRGLIARAQLSQSPWCLNDEDTEQIYSKHLSV